MKDGFGQERARSSYGGEVDGFVSYDRLSDGVASFSLSDHAAKAKIQKGRRILIHPAGCCRAGGADGLSLPGRRRPDIIYDVSADLKRQGPARVQRFLHPFMGGVPCGVNGSREVNAVSGLQTAGCFPVKGDRTSFFHIFLPVGAPVLRSFFPFLFSERADRMASAFRVRGPHSFCSHLKVCGPRGGLHGSRYSRLPEGPRCASDTC